MTNERPNRLKIAIAVHGRFEAFDLTRELLKRGHDVTLLTNYPKYVVRRFGVPPAHVETIILHGIAARLAYRLRSKGVPYPEAFLHRWFGRWAASRISKRSWDAVLCWSGIGEETFRVLQDTPTLRICRRGSSHIRTQARLLEEEERRTGVKLDRPSSWIISREEREYALADVVQGNSTFVALSMIEQGVPIEKTSTVLGAVELSAFRASPSIIEARCQRILAGEALRIIHVGMFTFRKGMWDMGAIIRNVEPNRYRFRFVGPIAPEAREFAKQLASQAEFIPKQPQMTLPQQYAWGDIFILPTIEDGYPMVSSQAAAAGLPILITTNSSAYDLVREGQTGWVLPIRSPEAFVEKLRWCDANREALVQMVRNTANTFQQRDWADAAMDFEQACYTHLPRRNPAWK